ncbi:TetR/AcrR family transcriptional regulator [Teichococcus wenyumeiae]|nr:TetR/AcrR family transcriptional regulator [Pseudoroseomonas wenyumeiae]RKK05262.1 TetR/AcrR family transcriptional regulator [Pseudoroseomonas wenyumeiae]
MQPGVTLERQACAHEAAEAAARARIFSAAEAAFTANGFHVATMDDIARRAGCSKKTIYKFFSSKEDLFFGLMDHSKEVVSQVRIDRSKGPEAALVAFLEEAGRIILSQDAASRRRMIMAEYTHSPALLAAAERRGAGTARMALESYLAELEQSGHHEIGDPREAAHMLMGMALGAFHHRLLLGVASSFPPEVIRERIVKSVRIYLRGTARPNANSASHPAPVPAFQPAE